MNQYKQKKLNKEQVKKRVLILAVILAIIVIMETSYIKSFELGLLSSVIK